MIVDVREHTIEDYDDDVEVKPQPGGLDPAPIFSRCGVYKPPHDVLWRIWD